MPEHVIARKRGVEVFVTYDDTAPDAEGTYPVLSYGIRGTNSRQVRVTIGLADGEVTTPILVADRTRTTNIASARRPRVKLITKIGDRVLDQPRLDGLHVSVTTFGA